MKDRNFGACISNSNDLEVRVLMISTMSPKGDLHDFVTANAVCFCIMFL